MLHVSTRGEAAPLSFSDALLAGLARDGGLYVPQTWPRISRDEIAALAGKPYAEAAKRVLRPLVDGEIADADLDRMIDDAYATFRHPAICPITQIDDNLFLLELFHGPTLAFKDVAMQLLGRLMDTSCASAAAGRPSSAPPPATPARPPSRRSAGSIRSTCSSSTRTGGSRRCSGGR